jgi:hypothetical protein
MGSLARLLAPAYRPALVSIICGIDAASVPRCEKRREANRTPFFGHRFLRACPSLVSTVVGIIAPPSIEDRYAELLRNAYKPSGVCEKTRPFFTYRATAAATNLLSMCLPFLLSFSEISAAPSGFPVSRRQSTISAGMLPGRGPLSFRLRRRRLPPLVSDSASLSFWRSSSNSFSRTAIASRITWAKTSLMGVAYLHSDCDASVHSSVTIKPARQPFCNTIGCESSKAFIGQPASGMAL